MPPKATPMRLANQLLVICMGETSALPSYSLRILLVFCPCSPGMTRDGLVWTCGVYPLPMEASERTLPPMPLVSQAWGKALMRIFLFMAIAFCLSGSESAGGQATPPFAKYVLEYNTRSEERRAGE